MFDKLYKWIFRKSYKKHIRHDVFLIMLGLYTKHVQSNRHAKIVRAAILWSATAALYLGWKLGVEGSGTLKVWDVQLGQVTQEKILWLLFTLNCYYTIRVLFSVAKAFSFINPFFVCRPLYCRKKMERSGAFHSKKKTTPIDIELCRWLDMLEKRNQPALGGTQSTNSKFQISRVPGRMQCEDQVRFMVRYPTLGLLENFFFPVIVAPALCIAVLGWLAVKMFCSC